MSLISGHGTDEPGEATGAEVPKTASDNVFGDANVAQVSIVAEKSLTAGHNAQTPEIRGRCDRCD
ncbi:putative uncharacterized protein [Mycolicibacterium fortuitum subsp. acetamidolyticum]|uniref:Uncharacterized protein n=1 Tax=Mycolicibacterium fortuitum subsp. acetamidolyticum TaxID=144550 RepID=A0A100WXH3_MYCFO|nr:putative uncharacterized protein [Mycolicibacterium fortuitum subsp. acetamidolyticum]